MSSSFFRRTGSSLISGPIKCLNSSGEILVHLGANISSDKTIDALYAFSDCEISISPNCCVIDDNKPRFVGVSEILRVNAEHTKELLKQELEIRLRELQENWHLSSLEKIFIEKRIYRDIEECETWESVIETIDKGLDPYKKLLMREVTRDDIIKLTEIKIKRISKFDAKRADELIKSLEEEMEEVKNHLENLVTYTINYFKQIKKKYGKGLDRRTELRNFASIEAAKVVVANQKLYMNARDGFIGTSLRKDDYVCDCSDIDDIIVFLKDGNYTISKVADKQFVGKNIIHAAVFKRNDSRTIYNVVYFDGNSGNVMMKRAPVTGITRDKQYNIGKEHKHSKILFFSANPNGEAEVIKVYLRPRPRLKTPVFEYDFAELAIKGRGAFGNILTKFSVQKIVLKEKGISTLGGRKVWFDEDVMRLNVDARGIFLGEFTGDDSILVITRSGHFRTTNFDLSNHFEDDLQIIEKYRENKIWSAAYYDAEHNYYYLKRFLIESGTKQTRFIGEHPESRLIRITEVEYPRLELKFGGKNRDRDPEIIEVAEFIGIKSWKARGKRLSNYEVKVIEEIIPEGGLEVASPAPESPKKESPKSKKPKTQIPAEEIPKARASAPKDESKASPRSKTKEITEESASHVFKQRVLHHGTLLFSSEMGVLSEALWTSGDRFTDRAVKSVRSQVTNIENHLEEPMDIGVFTDRLQGYFLKMKEPAKDYHFSLADREGIKALRDKKFSTWEWNFGYSPKYQFSRRIPAGEGHVQIHMNVEKGIIRELKIEGDFISAREIASLEQMLLGIIHDPETMRIRLSGVQVSEYILGLQNEELLVGMF